MVYSLFKIYHIMQKIILLIGLILPFGLSAQNALNFDGTNDNVNCGTKSAFNIGGDSITIEAWIYANSWKTNIYDGTIVNKENNSNDGGFMLRAGSGGKLGFGIGAGTNTGWYEINTSTGVLSLNTWHHVAATYDGNKLRAYVDGNLVDSTSSSINIGVSSTTPLTIGYHPVYGRNWDGSIDEVRLWDVVRTKAELNASKDAEFCGPVNNLKAYYKFDHGAANSTNTGINTVTDFSGNNNTANLINFALAGSSSNWVTGASLSQSSVTTRDTIKRCGPFYYAPTNKYYTSSTSFSRSLNTSYGCDSSVTTVIIINTLSTFSISAAVCDSFISPKGNVFKTSGTYYDILTAANGCDSVITINLKVGADTLHIDTAVCYAYTTPYSKTTYTTSGTYFDSTVNSLGCDSILQINLEIKGATFSSATYYTCDSFVSPSGKWMQANNTYLDTLVNYRGCDSILSISVQSWVTYDTLYPSACNSYISPSKKTFTNTGQYTDTTINKNGCFNLITIYLTLSNSTSDSIRIEGCKSVTTAEGAYTFTSSGVYKYTLTNASGCDSFLTINAVVHYSDTAVYEINNNELVANSTSGTYQWLDCENNFAPISGETSRSFIANTTGYYALEITENNCIDTSECHRIYLLDIADISTQFELYPNPANRVVYLNVSNIAGPVKLLLIASDGQLIKEWEHSSNVINLGELNAGIYFLQVKSDMGIGTKKLVVH